MSARRSILLTLPAIVAATGTIPATAEVYLNESQALAVVFGEGVTAKREQKTLDASTRASLEHSTNLDFPETSYTFFISDEGGHPRRYAVVLNEIGKSEPITFMVGMTPDGKVSDVAVMVFRENRGWEVKEKRFLHQFRGKTAKSSIRVNEDILNYTGATLSSKAIARGVKRALFLLDTFYPPSIRAHGSPSGDVVPSYSPAPLLWTDDAKGAVGLFRQRRIRMGTICEIRLWCRSSSEAQAAFAAGFAEIDRIEQMFSAYRANSELAVVNREAGGRPVELSCEFFDLTSYAIQSWKRSRGTFDITVGPLVTAWGLKQEIPRIPSRAELLAARNLVGSEKLILQRRGRTIQFQRQGMALDFGGLAKGHAAQQAAKLVQQHGVLAALVNLGGSSLAASEGATPTKKNSLADELGSCQWIVGVTDPGDPSRQALYLVLRPGWCLSTSGTYEQQVEINGARFSHLVDPRSGVPLGGVRSMTTIARSARRTEVLAKHLLALSSAARARIAQPLGQADWICLQSSRPDRTQAEFALGHSCRLTESDDQTDPLLVPRKV
jgi:thiamine biosynthesis lipoprotein ApbE/Na+-translocating ferredoxin:NAD+ oxidoreductase RnfG subunit